MRLLTFFLFAAFLTAHASGVSQTVTLSGKDIPLKQVFSAIKKQTGFFVLANRDLLAGAKPVSLAVSAMPLKEFLAIALRGQPLSYQMNDKTIFLSRKSPVVPEAPLTVVSSDLPPPVIFRVLDSEGKPLSGATFSSNSSKNKATLGVTDAEGRLSLNVSLGDRLLVSFVGFEPFSFVVTAEILKAGAFSVQLAIEVNNLDETIVIGYGSAKKRDLTGSVASISGTALKDIPVTSVAQAIVGRLAGVQVTQTEGSPDADIKIRIRGGGSITQDNSPLYIVDGFPVSDINDIVPNDIASIDILKDASSTAIYGARGANGVVIITTKGGSIGKGTVRYNDYFGIKEITKTLDVLDPYEYAYWQYELQDGQPNAQYLGDFQDFGLYKQMKGTNWQDKIFGRTGTSMEHNLSFSGGTKSSKYNISLTRNDEKEIMLGSGYTRTNLSIKTSNQVNNWLSADLNVRLSDYSLQGAGTSSGSRLSHAIQFRPMEGLNQFVDADLSDADFEISNQYVLNPVLQTNDDYRRANRMLYNFSGALGIKFSKELSFRMEGGIEYREGTNKRFYGLNTTNALQYGSQPLASSGKTNNKSYHIANILTYSRKWGSGNNLTAMLGQELNSSTSEALTTSAKYFPKYIDATSALSMMSLGAADPIITMDNPDVKTTSFFSRINYALKGRYMASATLRADGSSKFAPGNQWGYFPAAGLAWRMSDENFMSSSKNWLSDLKLRFSYGQSGNNRIADDAWKKTYSVTTGGFFLGESSPTAFLVPGTVLSNPRLKWETTISRNLGLDFDLFNGRLSGSLEVYKNTTKDLLVAVSIPSNTGYNSQLQNIGQTSNKGIEVTLNGAVIEKRDFRLTGSFNIGFNRNNIDRLGENKFWTVSSEWLTGGDAPTNDYLVEEGKSVGRMYGYVTEGMYSVDDFNYDETTGIYTLKDGVTSSSNVTLSPVMPGTLKLKDQNGDHVITDDDKAIIGNANPKFTGGLNLTATYKGFDCSAFFNWVYGNDIYNANKIMFTSAVSGRPWKSLLDIMNSENRYTYWDQTTGEYVTDPVKLVKMNSGKTMWSANIHKGVFHSWAVEDGSFLRLNNLTIGYSLPEKLLNKMSIQQLRIYATGYNLWTWTKYSGYDPEVDSRRATPLTPGVDWNAYPRSRTYNVGLNLTF